MLVEAQEEERARLAEELHDGPAQVLSNAVLRVRVVERALRSDTAAAMAELEGLRLDLERETERLRDYIRQLRPTLLEPGDLASEHQRDRAASSGTTRASRWTWTSPLPRRSSTRRAAPRCSESPWRRSGTCASTPTPGACVSRPAWSRPIRRTSRAGGVLEVQDDGEGFAVDDASEHGGRRHFGLRFMRERAQHVGGELEIVSEAAAGTTVRLRLHPLERGRTTW